jgi:F0F1-type ATP synthase membrane subunit b/b'
MDLEGAVALSFIGFVCLFIRKIYPHLIEYLDGYIEGVKKQVSDVENYKNSACADLNRARAQLDETKTMLQESRQQNESKMDALRVENERVLRTIRKKYESSGKLRLKAELATQKHLLIERVADVLVKKIKQDIRRGDHHIEMDIKKEDLEKLLS